MGCDLKVRISHGDVRKWAVVDWRRIINGPVEDFGSGGILSRPKEDELHGWWEGCFYGAVGTPRVFKVYDKVRSDVCC